MDGTPRSRNPPSAGSRPSNESRRPPGAPGGPPPPSSGGSSSRSTMSRAERFEDERRRITSSCFGKLDADGSLHESYITHIRIQEDSAYPQTPPPPGGAPNNKKPRVIIITVKNTSRVSLHKARENANGTFSVGKTWHMADLSHIENFVYGVPRDEEQAQFKQWAGQSGFTVTVNKPYYWEASTAKEKEFFIGSLVKIYNKYTDKHHIGQGKFPVLTGFSVDELNTLTENRPFAATEEGRAAHEAWMERHMSLKPPPDDSDPYAALRRNFEGRNRNGPRTPQPSPGDSRRPPPLENRNLPPPRGQGRPPTAEGPRRDMMPRQPGTPSMPNMRDAAATPQKRPSEDDRPLPPPQNGALGPPAPRRRPSGDDRPLPLPSQNGPLGRGVTPPPPGSRQSPRPPPANEQNIRSRPSRENLALRPSQSRERLAPMPSATPPIPAPSPQRRLSPQSSRADLRPKTPDAAHNSSVPAALSIGRPPVPNDARSQRPQNSPMRPSFEGASSKPGRASAEERRPNGLPLPVRRDTSPNRGLRPGTAQSNASSVFSRNDERPDETAQAAKLPERLRPQMETRSSQQSQRSVASSVSGPVPDFYTPSQSPAPMAPPPRRRPQEPERPKAAPGDDPAIKSETNRRDLHGNALLSSTPPPPPPTSPLPQLPKAPERKVSESKPPTSIVEKQMPPRAAVRTPPPPAEKQLPPLAAVRTPSPLVEKKPSPTTAVRSPSPLVEKKPPPIAAVQSPSPVVEKPPPPIAPLRTATPVVEKQTPPGVSVRSPPPPVPDKEPPEKEQPPIEVQPLKVVPPVKEEPAAVKPEKESPVAPVTPSEGNEDEQANHRPGLGPMIKKSLAKPTAANTLRKAAAAAGAFKPRIGGAAAKILSSKDTKPSDEPDGISAVFVPQRAAPKQKAENKPVEKKPEEEPKTKPDRGSKDLLSIDTEVVPQVKVISPMSPPTVVPTTVDERALSPSPTPEKPETKAEPEAEVRRKKRRSNQQIMNISKLGIDPGILDGQGLEFEILLAEFGWGSSELSAKNIQSLESDIKREIARVEAGSWLSHLEQKDDRVETVERMLDRAIAECDELEGLLTLYNVELSSLNDDVAFIEAQGQGLQVQTANQRLLQNELKQLVDTISITPEQLEALRRARIGKVNDLIAIESSLVLLYKALVTIDPAFVEGRRGSTAGNGGNGTTGIGNSEVASMQALQEKKDRYLTEGTMFLDRLKKHMEITFGAAFLQTKDALARIDSNAMPSTKANVEAHDAGRKMLWMLSPLILFAKEIDQQSWTALIQMYQSQAGTIYQDEIRDNISSWKRFARKPTGDEQDLLFTAQEKEPESMAGAARKLTVKRSQTLARGLRVTSGDKEGKASKAQDGKLYAFDVFSKALDDIGPVLLTEQNFITEFFHATSTGSVEFPEAVNAALPEDRQGPNLWVRKQFEADRVMAKRVADVMEDIFSFWPTEIQNLVEWSIKADPLQGIGILYAVDRKLRDIEDSNQDFLTRNLQKVHERLTGLFTRFVDEQIRAIEDTKVKIKKRKGVISFMKTFPHFAVAIENMLPASEEADHLEIRRMVDDAYKKINKAMFESLKVIAKESPAVMATQGQGDPEDKEALNYHILLIENMNHYTQEVDGRSESVLLEWKTKAQEEMKEHMDLYVDAVIRRPLGKLLDFIESTETLLKQPGGSPQAISQRSSHSRSVFKKLVHSYDAKEIRKGIEALKKRVDKHFGDADDINISRDLVFKVLKECESRYNNVHERTVRINQDVYSGEVETDWGVNDISAAFRR